MVDLFYSLQSHPIIIILRLILLQWSLLLFYIIIKKDQESWRSISAGEAGTGIKANLNPNIGLYQFGGRKKNKSNFGDCQHVF